MAYDEKKFNADLKKLPVKLNADQKKGLKHNMETDMKIYKGMLELYACSVPMVDTSGKADTKKGSKK